MSLVSGDLPFQFFLVEEFPFQGDSQEGRLADPGIPGSQGQLAVQVGADLDLDPAGFL